MAGICDYLLTCWRPSVSTTCDSGFHEHDPNSASSFDPVQNANQVASSSEGEASPSSKGIQSLRQPERAETTDREAASTMRSLIQTIIPGWQNPRSIRDLAADHSRLTFSLQQSRSALQQADIRLRQAHDELQQANSELHRANNEVRQLKDSVTHCQTELRTSQDEILRLQNKERSMRDFLIENNHNQIVSDRDVCERFTQLRQRIQRLASNKAYNIEEYEDLKLNENWFEPRYIEALWAISSKPGRLLILRSLIFQLLFANILDKLLFDINGAGENLSLSRLCNPIPSLSQPLSVFERVLIDRGVNDDILVNWRLSTFKCIESAGLGGSDLCATEGDYMFKCFQGFISKQATPPQIEKMRNGYRELCKEAWALRLLMRNSLEPFECYVSPGCQLRGLEDWYEAIGEISHVPGMTGEFAFPIFGALVKHTKVDGGSVKVLEKAQCIVAVPST